MNKLLFTFLAIAIIFSACEKEEEPTNSGNTTPTTYAFSCKIEGADFTDNSPVATIESSTNVLTLDAKDGDNTIRIIIYNFSDRNVGEEISLNYGSGISGALVTKDDVDYTNTQSGKLIFTKIDAELSGTFNFTSRAVDFSSKSVTEGVFEDLSY